MAYVRTTWVSGTTKLSADNFNNIEDGIEEAKSDLKVLKVSATSVSSLPKTISNANITSSMEVVNCVLSNPSAQTGDWTVTTSAGSLSVSGTISGTTNITLYLQTVR